MENLGWFQAQDVEPGDVKRVPGRRHSRARGDLIQMLYAKRGQITMPSMPHRTNIPQRWSSKASQPITPDMWRFSRDEFVFSLKIRRYVRLQSGGGTCFDAQ